MESVFADRTISISEFRASPARKVSEANGRPIAVLVNNKPEFYVVPSALFAKIADIMDDLAIVDTVRERLDDENFVEVDLEEL